MALFGAAGSLLVPIGRSPAFPLKPNIPEVEFNGLYAEMYGVENPVHWAARILIYLLSSLSKLGIGLRLPRNVTIYNTPSVITFPNRRAKIDHFAVSNIALPGAVWRKRIGKLVWFGWPGGINIRIFNHWENIIGSQPAVTTTTAGQNAPRLVIDIAQRG